MSILTKLHKNVPVNNFMSLSNCFANSKKKTVNINVNRFVNQSSIKHMKTYIHITNMSKSFWFPLQQLFSYRDFLLSHCTLYLMELKRQEDEQNIGCKQYIVFYINCSSSSFSSSSSFIFFTNAHAHMRRFYSSYATFFNTCDEV